MAPAFPNREQLGRCVVMGVVNVTPDSFSDGGRYVDTTAAIEHGLALAADGADLIDVGGESTRPGASRVAADVEAARVVPVIAELARQGIATTVDTMRAEVAGHAVEAGCAGINDVSGGLADPAMAPLAAALDVPFILMHWRAHSDRMRDFAQYDDVVTDVLAELAARVADAEAAGVRRDRIILDPGLGFAKTAAHNWQLLAHLPRLVDAGLPVLIGASRKSFLGVLLAGADGPRPPEQREDATTAITALSAHGGAWGVRTHQVRASRDAVAVAQALAKGTG